MQIIDEERLCFIQAMHNDDWTKILPDVKGLCRGVEQIAVIRKKFSDSDTEWTWVFKGAGKTVVQHTWDQTWDGGILGG